jgi:hypothetical protein
MANITAPRDTGNFPIPGVYDAANRVQVLLQGGVSSVDPNTGDRYAGTALAIPTATYGHVILDANTIATYAASVIGLSPATSATDIVILNGSATKIIRVMRVVVSALTSAATGVTLDLVLAKRSTANTGTSAAMTAVPFDSADAAATATCVSYTANPSPLGTLVGNVYVTKFQQSLGTATATDFPSNLPFMAQWGVTDSKPIVLRGVAEGLALNFNGVSFAAGASVDVTVEWTES